MADGFDLNNALQSPWTQTGMALLGASRQPNQWQAALANMQQMQQSQQQMAAFGLQQQARKRQLEQEQQRQQFLQQQQDALVQAGPPAPAAQQQLTRLGGMQAGLSPQEIGALEEQQPSEMETARKGIIQLGGANYLQWSPDKKNWELKTTPIAQDEQRQQLAERTVGVKERMADIAQQRANQYSAAQQAKAPSAAAARIPMEVIRMDIGMENADKALDRFEQALRGIDPNTKKPIPGAGFDPRDPADQFNMGKRGRISSIAGELLLQGKESGALGALQKADVALMEKILASPTSPQGALLGQKGILSQIKAARESFADRRATMRKRYPSFEEARQAGAGPTRATAPQRPSAGPSDEDIEYTAQKHGVTVEEVKQRLGIQ